MRQRKLFMRQVTGSLKGRREIGGHSAERGQRTDAGLRCFPDQIGLAYLSILVSHTFAPQANQPIDPSILNTQYQ